MDLGEVGSLVLKSNLRNPLALPPSAFAVLPPQPRKFSDPRSHRKGFDMRDLSDDCEMHGGIFPERGCGPAWWAVWGWKLETPGHAIGLHRNDLTSAIIETKSAINAITIENMDRVAAALVESRSCNTISEATGRKWE